MTSCASLNGRTMKITRDDDTRRMKLDFQADAGPNAAFAAIKAAVIKAYQMPEARVVDMKLCYADEEGDLCTLTEQTLEDFAMLCPDGVLRLTMTLREPASQDAEMPGVSSRPSNVAAPESFPSPATQEPPSQSVEEADRSDMGADECQVEKAPKTCPSGHSLQAAPNSGNVICDVCGRSSKTGAILYGCRSCDYDQCELCFEPKAVFLPGTLVRVHSLQAAPELNGLTGTCEQFSKEKGRWLVKLQTGEAKALKPVNLELAASTDEANVEFMQQHQELAELLKNHFLAKLDANARVMIGNVLQNMDEQALQGLLNMVINGKGKGKGRDEPAARIIELASSMKPADLKRLLLHLLATTNGCDRPSSSEGPNPMAGLLAMLPMLASLGGKGNGYGKAGSTSQEGSQQTQEQPQGQPHAQQPNPMDFLGAMLGGMGKGGAAATNANTSQQPPNPFACLGTLLGGIGKGFGKGGCTSAARDVTMRSEGQCGSRDAWADVNRDVTMASAPAAAVITNATAAPAPAATATTNATADVHTDASRDAFDQSVASLVEMGLVSDAQTARQLLTQHGDVSSVVAALED